MYITHVLYTHILYTAHMLYAHHLFTSYTVLHIYSYSLHSIHYFYTIDIIHVIYYTIHTIHIYSYSLQRKSFNQPISSLYAIQAKLADMSSRIDAARLCVYYSGDLY